MVHKIMECKMQYYIIKLYSFTNLSSIRRHVFVFETLIEIENKLLHTSTPFFSTLHIVHNCHRLKCDLHIYYNNTIWEFM